MSKRDARERWWKAGTRWQNLLWLNGYNADYYIQDDDEQLEGVYGENYHAAAIAESKPHYRHFALTAQRKFAEGMSDKRLDELACHEMIHVKLAPMNDIIVEAIYRLPEKARAGWLEWWERVREGVTTDLAAILLFPDPELIKHLQKRMRWKR